MPNNFFYNFSETLHIGPFSPRGYINTHVAHNKIISFKKFITTEGSGFGFDEEDPEDYTISRGHGKAGEGVSEEEFIEKAEQFRKKHERTKDMIDYTYPDESVIRDLEGLAENDPNYWEEFGEYYEGWSAADIQRLLNDVIYPLVGR